MAGIRQHVDCDESAHDTGGCCEEECALPSKSAPSPVWIVYENACNEFDRDSSTANPAVPPCGTQELFTKSVAAINLKLSSTRGRAVQQSVRDSKESWALSSWWICSSVILTAVEFEFSHSTKAARPTRNRPHGETQSSGGQGVAQVPAIGLHRKPQRSRTSFE